MTLRCERHLFMNVNISGHNASSYNEKIERLFRAQEELNHWIIYSRLNMHTGMITVTAVWKKTQFSYLTKTLDCKPHFLRYNSRMINLPIVAIITIAIDLQLEQSL